MGFGFRFREITYTARIGALAAAVAATGFFAAADHAVAKPGASAGTPKSAKNLIVLISDGCGYNQLDAASYYQYGRTGRQVYENFPVRVGMSTYEWDGSYDPAVAWLDFNYFNLAATDSASAATTMSSGIKTDGGKIGVDENDVPVKHLMEYAEEMGKATGVVSTVEFSHATPAGFVAHNASRNNYADIANEMIYDSATDVIMGCGNPEFNDSGVAAPQNPRYVGGATTWADIANGSVTGADANGDGNPDDWTAVFSRGDFQDLMSGDTPDRVLGIPQVYTTLQQSRGGDGSAGPYVVPLTATVPTLEEMTKGALNVLDNDDDGFVLMIEGGAVDWASHANQSGRVIEEEIDFNRSVEAVTDWVRANSNWGETVVVVTGDHETGYLTGPGSDEMASGPVWNDLVNNGAGNLPGMEWHSGGHTNQLIPFFAKGDVAREMRKAADEYDPVHGLYLDNAELGEILIAALGR